MCSGMCPCDSQQLYVSCCAPFIAGKKNPKTPEALMRSRYTAYTLANIDYIKETMRGSALTGFDETAAKRWALKVNWIKLKVLKVVLVHASTGYVEFEASFVDGSRLKVIHEYSEFSFAQGRWYYIGGVHYPTAHAEQMISRGMNCPCGSQRKFKNCHG